MNRSVHIEWFVCFVCVFVFFLKQMSFDPNLLHNNGHNGYPNGTSAALRETGVIEKLLTSYGFIQCSERQARLFFHCSQYNGNLQDLKVGGNLLAHLLTSYCMYASSWGSFPVCYKPEKMEHFSCAYWNVYPNFYCGGVFLRSERLYL